jgi:hypothetical protein
MIGFGISLKLYIIEEYLIIDIHQESLFPGG